MAERAELPKTQRAYTLRLRGIDGDTDWRDALWATHEAVNKGAKAFGDWLLTLRGGLSHELADDGPPDQRKDRRILLALSWLSVEDARGAPDEYEVKRSRVTGTLLDILQRRGVSDAEAETWKVDCGPSLRAEIREDAVWVNRSAAFDAAAADCATLTRDELWDFLEPFFAGPKAYLAPEMSDGEGAGTTSTEATEEKAKDLVQKAGGWLSKRMGTGKGANFARMSKACERIAAWAKTATAGSSGDQLMIGLACDLSDFAPKTNDAKGVVRLISGPGYKGAARNQVVMIAAQTSVSRKDLDKLAEWAAADAIKCAEKVGGKGRRLYSDRIITDVEQACGFTYINVEGAARHREFSVMLDHAARRVNVAHSWIKNAEAERRHFEADSQRIANVPPDALAWLEAYCESRKGTSGAIDTYRIRRRAIDGWDKVVARWSRADCPTTEDRIKAARASQDDPDIDKFGDIQLFEALAEDDAECVWKPGGKPSDQPLKDFVFATDAMAKKLRFKVPAYRHPDPLRHPVFTDFGNSRWDINFSAHRAPAALAHLVAKVVRLGKLLADAEQKLAATSAAKREKLTANVAKLRRDLERSQRDHAAMADRHQVQLRLWGGRAIEPTAVRWACKRLIGDLSLRPTNGIDRQRVAAVTRADRLGRAAVGAGENDRVSIADLFDEDDWNGRLQAPRKQLDVIARRVEKHGWDAKAQTMRQRIRWLLSFSAKLTPQGPWTEFAAKLNLKPDPQYWPHAEANKNRKSHARLVLSRLPGLRVLAVDLGHRFAAACAVWEAITPPQITAACKAAGAKPPASDAMYLHLKGTNPRGKQTITVYRRIGSDSLPDGSPHSAPWARLDRQFLIKLQGEDQPARKASPDEIKAVEHIEQWAGLLRRENKERELAVDCLMSDTVRTARLALARHSRCARIAFNLTADVRVRPGGIREPLTDQTRLQLLVDTLADWHALASDDRWDDVAARKLWNSSLTKLQGGFPVAQREPPNEGDEPSRAERKKAQEELVVKLQPLAGSLANDDALAGDLHDLWTARWKADDEECLDKLKWLSRWLMPHGGTRRAAGRRHVGGLSLSRISTLVDFRRKVQVGFFTRMKPDGTRTETDRHFGQKTLDRIERLKDNRIKQLASRIVEAAHGIGIERHSASGRDIPRPCERINDPRFAPCHAVVIEDLEHYRPEETKTRRENRQTMDWKSAEARKRLADHCQLYGLHLRDVNPQYTSRQDSRTGAPGMRCVEVEIGKYLSAPLWRKQIAQAKRKSDEKKADARDKLLLDIFARYENASGAMLKQRVLVPLKGGDLFVSADPNSAAARGIQADLNAAANIGLRALMDPDFTGRWWYVPCDLKTKAPKTDKIKGSILDGVGALADTPSAGDGEQKQRDKASKGKPKEIVNLWRDPSAQSILDVSMGAAWQDTPHYWNDVQARVVTVLHEKQEGWPQASELPF